MLGGIWTLTYLLAGSVRCVSVWVYTRRRQRRNIANLFKFSDLLTLCVLLIFSSTKVEASHNGPRNVQCPTRCTNRCTSWSNYYVDAFINWSEYGEWWFTFSLHYWILMLASYTALFIFYFNIENWLSVIGLQDRFCII